MARKLIYEVLMRSENGNTSLGFFTDDFLATQAVAHLYDLLRKSVAANDPTVAVISDAVKAVGWEMWYDTNRRENPVFFYRPANLYNSVPTSITNFTFLEETDAIPF